MNQENKNTPTTSAATESSKYPSRILKSDDVVDYIRESLIEIDFFYLGYTNREMAETKDNDIITAKVYGKLAGDGKNYIDEYYVFFDCDTRMYKFDTLEDAIDLIYELGQKIRPRTNTATQLAMEDH